MRFILTRSSDWKKSIYEQERKEYIEIGTLEELLEFADNATGDDGRQHWSIVLERGPDKEGFRTGDGPWCIEIYDDYRE